MLPHSKKNIIKRRSQTRGRTLYTSKKYSNPFFDKKRQRKYKKVKLSSKRKIIFFVLFLLSLGLIYFFLYSGFFAIKNIKTVTTDNSGRINNEEIKNIASEEINSGWFVLLPQKNIFLFNVKNLQDNLNRKYAFEKLTIDKKLPNTIVIAYKEKNYSFIWQEREKNFYIDDSGYVIKEAEDKEIENKQYPHIENKSNIFIDNQHIPAAKEFLSYVNNIEATIKENAPDFKIEKFIFTNKQTRVEVKLKRGPIIIFSSKRAAGEQFKKVLIIKQETLQDDFFKKKYFDVRIGSSVYYQ